MRKILVLNCGSSSIKYRLFDKKLNSLVRGKIERIGEKEPRLIHWKNKSLFQKVVKNVKDHEAGIKLMLSVLQDAKWGALKSLNEIFVVGHRVVHGGEISKPTIVTNKTLKHVEKLSILAPLHNPHNVAGIKIMKKILPKVKQVMVFDTAFHQTIPQKAYMYALPYEFYEKFKIRRYGFHGTSHKYVAIRASKLLRKAKPNLITCHLGAGSSITAISNGRSIDTSMGFTPLEGVMMGTRTGDIDAAIVQYLVDVCKLSFDDVFEIMNKKSGLLGISGISKDVRPILAGAKKGNKRCKLALEMFCYRVAKYIGAYSVLLDNVDAIVFTAGIGENAPWIREKICSYLKILGVKLDKRKNNNAIAKEALISSKKSCIKVFVIPTDEELMIAKEAVSVI
ncbi:acetate kinase [Candidatus Woesearchaeota archaeon]|mgnify:CR=1 FL=1|nr:MAG: acetate kinase [Candidatus Woesearchaeota archaeon]